MILIFDQAVEQESRGVRERGYERVLPGEICDSLPSVQLVGVGDTLRCERARVKEST